MPAEGSISYAELAEKIQVSEDVIRRIARYAITKHIFREVHGGDGLAHSATSKMLADSPMMMEWIGMVCEEMWPAATQAVPALKKWPKSQEPQHSVSWHDELNFELRKLAAYTETSGVCTRARAGDACLRHAGGPARASGALRQFYGLLQLKCGPGAAIHMRCL